MCRVLARISKVPVQNSNFKIFARPDLATYLLKILIPAIINSLVCQKGNLLFSYVLKGGLLGKYLVTTPLESKLKKIFMEFFACPNRRFLGNYLSKRQVGWFLAKSLIMCISSEKYRFGSRLIETLSWLFRIYY